MRSIIFGAGILIASIGMATSVKAEDVDVVHPPAASGAPVAHLRGESAVTTAWIAARVLAGSGGERAIVDEGTALNGALSESFRSAKPQQNPAFRAAFVFQSNSASFLAAASGRRGDRRGPPNS